MSRYMLVGPALVALLGGVAQAQAGTGFDSDIAADFNGDGNGDTSDAFAMISQLGRIANNPDASMGVPNDQVWRDNFQSGGVSRFGFHGETGTSTVPTNVDLAFGGLPLRPLFESDQAYYDWVAPITSAVALPGDVNADGVVDATDYNDWVDALDDQIFTSLSDFTTLAGDFDFDGDTDDDDFGIWAARFAPEGGSVRAAGPLGDFDGDGEVTPNDFIIWQVPSSALGQRSADIDLLWAINIPAPGAVVAFGCVGVCIRRRR